MKKKRILFVCAANVHRSVTAEELYKDDPRYEVGSRGVNEYARMYRSPLTKGDLKWADSVFVMNRIMKSIIGKELESGPEVISLDVPDAYDTQKPE